MRALLPGYHGYELFPTEFRTVDTANQYHLWAFEGGGPFHACRPEQVSLQEEYELARLTQFQDAESLGVRLLRSTDPRTACDWRALQRLKESLFREREAALYHAPEAGHPLEGWLICLTREGAAFPFGFPRGVVADAGQGVLDGSCQRPFDEPSAKSG